MSRRIVLHEHHVDPVVFATACYEFGPLLAMDAWKMHMHLVQNCPGCLKVLLDFYGFASFEEMATLEEPRAELARRAELRELKPLLGSLDPLPEVEQFSQVSHDSRFHTAAMAKALLRRCRSRWGSEPHAALQDSTLAILAMGKVPSDDLDLPRGGVAEFSALGWAHQGNVFRILCDLQQAEHSFAKANQGLNAEAGDPLVRAMVLQLRSSLLRAQRRFTWAMGAIDEAVKLFEAEGKRERQGKALLVSAKLRADAGRPESALEELRRAKTLLQPVGNHRLASLFASLEVGILWHLKRFEVAVSLLPEAKRLASGTGNSTDPLRIRWSEARITTGLGNTDKAEALYEEVRQGFLDLDSAYDVALVSLELAQLYSEQERHVEIQQLAIEMIPIFQSREIHRETLAAVKLFADAVRGEEEELEAIGQLSAYLANARHDPSMRFSL